MVSVQIDLERDIKEEFRKGLESFRHTVPTDISFPEICHTYFNLKHRVIYPQKRTVELSKELQQKNISANHQKVIDEIKTLSESGQSIVAYQSRKIVLNAKYDDALLNDWGIHHLHLSSSPYPKDTSFRDRTDSLLYCHATDTKLLLIDLLDHKSFSEPELFKVFAANWPEITNRFKLNGILPPSKEEDHFNKKTVQIARKSGLMSMVTIGDSVYASPGGGYSSARTSMKVRMETDSFMRYISDLESYVTNNPEDICEWFKKAIPDNPPTSFIFKIDFGDRGTRLRELNTGLYLQVLEDKITITSI